MENLSNKKIVLVVDDDENLRDVLVDKLIISGFGAVGAEDGEEGLKKALELHPDVILLDVIMPKIGGWEMLEMLRKDPWGKNVKVIMLTVLENLNNVAQGVDNNIFGYLVKSSLSLDDVVTHVEEAVRKS
jgi:DNA-binding response OmpR family regulator